MRSGSLTVKSHQRRLLGLSGVKLSLSARRGAAGSPSVANTTAFPYMDSWTGITEGRFKLVLLCSFCAEQQVVSPPWRVMGVVMGALCVSGWGKHWISLSVFISVKQSFDLHCHVTPLNEKSAMTIDESQDLNMGAEPQPHQIFFP